MTQMLPRCSRDRVLASLTTWQIGGPADLFAEPETIAELETCLRFARAEGLPVLALGGASNMLIADEGFRGLVVRYRDESQTLEVEGDRARLRIGSGALLSRTARRTARQGWAGLEWAEGIPGTIGGAIVGNAGAYGGEIAGVIESVTAYSIDPGLRILSCAECEFAYRSSRFKRLGLPAGFIVAAELGLARGDPAQLDARLREIAALRKSKSPAGRSCGSVFQNPPGEAAGRLIDRAGLRGSEEGPAQISSQHGNYIVNRGGATARQILALIRRARERVLTETGITLQPEVRLVGFPEEAIRDLTGGRHGPGR
jgi:UDP-N-acetylmuramate dehydrogenase